MKTLRIKWATTLADGTTIDAGTVCRLVRMVEQDYDGTPVTPDAVVRFQGGVELQVPADELEEA